MTGMKCGTHILKTKKNCLIMKSTSSTWCHFSLSNCPKITTYSIPEPNSGQTETCLRCVRFFSLHDHVLMTLCKSSGKVDTISSSCFCSRETLSLPTMPWLWLAKAWSNTFMSRVSHMTTMLFITSFKYSSLNNKIRAQCKITVQIIIGVSCHM